MTSRQPLQSLEELRLVRDGHLGISRSRTADLSEVYKEAVAICTQPLPRPFALRTEAPHREPKLLGVVGYPGGPNISSTFARGVPTIPLFASIGFSDAIRLHFAPCEFGA